jgi:hypothetical protein
MVLIRPLDIKEVTDEGKFVGMASVYGNTDLGGDVVERGAFAKTLQENPVIPILWHHDAKEAIGHGTLRSTRDGLEVAGELDMLDPTAQKALRKMKLGLSKGLSIGFQSIQDEIKNGVRHLKEIKLWEVSVVTFPMNILAFVTGVKDTAQKGDFLTELDAIQTWSKRYQMMSALDSSLSSIIWSNDSNEEKMDAATESVNQFSASFLGFLPQFLALMDSVYKSAVEGFDQKQGADLVKAHRARIDEAAKEFLALLTTKAADPAPSREPAAVPEADAGKESALSNLFDELKGALAWSL